MIKQKYQIGNINMRYLPIVTAGVMMLTCIVNYIICNRNGTCKPFPSTTITSCSTMYPNNVIFRLFMTFPAFGLLLLFQLVYSWMVHQAKKTIFKKVVVSNMVRYLGFLGFPFYIVTVATIDGGKQMDWQLHYIGAFTFFTVWTMDCWIILFTLVKIFKGNPLLLNYKSLGVKLACCLYQWYYFTQLLVKAFQPGAKEFHHYILVEIEWGIMFSNLIYILSFYFEFKNVTMSLDENLDLVMNDIKEKQEELKVKEEKYTQLQQHVQLNQQQTQKFVQQQQLEQQQQQQQQLQQQQVFYQQQQPQQQQQQVFYQQQYQAAPQDLVQSVQLQEFQKQN